jgi:glycosyltransferase involved in cell wall biosynthesis
MIKPPPKRPRQGLNLLFPGCARLEPHYEPVVITGESIQPVRNDGVEFPLISITVPSFNQGHFIGATIESVISQNYPNLELIIVDGGSTDETVEVIKRYEHHIKWWVSEDDQGQANAINKGMSHATGDILAWLNSDDCLMPGALFRVAEQFMDSTKTDVVYGHRVLINEAGQDVGKWIMPGHRKFILTYADFIPQETMFWRAGLWRRVGGKLDESFRFAMDWELIRRFLDADATFQLIPAFLGQFRMHEMQKTNANIESDGIQEMEIIRQRCRRNFSSHPALQNLYYRMQRASFYSFVIRARMTEILWRTKLIKIHS